MVGKIYLIGSDEQLTPLQETPYDSEDLLQSLLGRYPDILAGEQVDRASPRRWCLISREMAVPGEDGGSGRWSLDHLLVDQDAIPTFVEVKRSTDTRIRREVVGQMLDYAANATVYWPPERVRATFEANCEREGRDPNVELSALLGADADPDSFWQTMDTNLRAGRIRMAFVADEIPSELQRIIEFLNGQMAMAQVIGVEIRQFVGGGVRTLVPRVVGLTATVAQAQSARSRGQRDWDAETFFGAIAEQHGAETERTIRAIYAIGVELADEISWGRGQTQGSCYFRFHDIAGSYGAFMLWTSCLVGVGFGYLVKSGPFQAEAERMQLRDRVNAIPGVSIRLDQIGLYPSFSTTVLATPEALAQFRAVVEWVRDRFHESR